MKHAPRHYVILFVSLQEGTMAYDVEIIFLVLEGLHPDISLSIYYAQHFLFTSYGELLFNVLSTICFTKLE
jgi:hypothetical protein